MKCILFAMLCGLIVSLTGCEKKKSIMQAIADTTGASHEIDARAIELRILVAGQSNSVRFTPEGEASFRATLAQTFPNARVEFVNCGENGTSIAQWAANGARINNCVQMAQGRTFTHLWWYQGETDALQGTLGYGTQVLAVWNALNTALNSNMRIYYAQLATTTLPAFQGHWQTIKDELASLQSPQRTIVTTEDLLLHPDGIHLDTQGQIDLGKRVAQKFIEGGL